MVTIDEDYSKHPVSISEIKSDRTNQAKDWTVRDMLIFMLRNIDNGGEFSKADRAVIALGFVDEQETGIIGTRMIQAGVKNRFESLGLLAQTANSIANQNAE